MLKNIAGLGLVAALAAAPASATTLYVGHGIPAPDGLPVDICLVTGDTTTTLFTGVTFDTFASVNDVLGVEALDAGRYDVEVRLSDGACTGDIAAAASIFLGLGENATAFAHLSEQGTPTITKFTNDFRALEDGKTRFYARHAAAAGDVDALVGQSRSNKLIIPGLENPDQEGVDLEAGIWGVAIFPAGSRERPPLFAARLPLDAGIGYFAYAVGSPTDDTFTVIIQALTIE